MKRRRPPFLAGFPAIAAALWAIAAALWAGPAAAFWGDGCACRDQASPWVKHEGVKLRLVAAKAPWPGAAAAGTGREAAQATAAERSTRCLAGLQIKLAPGWHTYWRSPGTGGLPPHFDWATQRRGVDTGVARVTTLWPAPELAEVEGLQVAAYRGEVVLPLVVDLVPGAGRPVLKGRVKLAVCKEMCALVEAPLELALPAPSAAPGERDGAYDLIAAHLARVPVPARRGGSLYVRQVLEVGATPRTRRRLLVEVRSEQPLLSPRLFLETGRGVLVERQRFWANAGGGLFELDLRRKADTPPLAHEPARVTLSSESRAVEARVMIRPARSGGGE